jgi:hypothetical protein
MLSRRHVNVFSLGREVSKSGVTRFTYDHEKFSSPDGRRRYENLAEHGDRVAVHHDVQLQCHDRPGRLPPQQAGTRPARTAAAFGGLPCLPEYNALKP